MLTSLHSGTERACDFARTVRIYFSHFIIVNYANSVLALLLDGVCPFQEIGGIGI